VVMCLAIVYLSLIACRTLRETDEPIRRQAGNGGAYRGGSGTSIYWRAVYGIRGGGQAGPGLDAADPF